MGLHEYPRSLRLLTPKDFREVFAKADRKAANPHFLFLARFNNTQHHRMGFVIAKKHVKTAVARNAIKRVTRDYFRINLSAQTDKGLDIVVLARDRAKELNKAEVKKNVSKLFTRLQNPSKSKKK